MWLTDYFVKRPLSVLITGYAALIFLTYLSVALEFFMISDQIPRYWGYGTARVPHPVGPRGHTPPRNFLIWDFYPKWWSDKRTIDLFNFNLDMFNIANFKFFGRFPDNANKYLEDKIFL